MSLKSETYESGTEADTTIDDHTEMNEIVNYIDQLEEDEEPVEIDVLFGGPVEEPWTLN